MLSYPVRAALASGLFAEVVVSTDDSDIAETAGEAGARVMERPQELADDRSTIVQVCLHTLEVLEARGELVDDFCCVLATAIFLRPDDFRESYALLRAELEADVVLGVSEYDLHPFQALRGHDGFLEMMWPEYRGMKSQQYPKLVASNGTLTWARAEPFRRARTFYVKRLKGYEIPLVRAVDIDTQDDLERARLLARVLLTGHY